MQQLFEIQRIIIEQVESCFFWKDQFYRFVATEHICGVIEARGIGKTTFLLRHAIDKIHPLDLAAFLDTREIAIRSGHLCAQPLLRFFGLEHAARASFALYNPEEELLRFTEVVHAAAKILR